MRDSVKPTHGKQSRSGIWWLRSSMSSVLFALIFIWIAQNNPNVAWQAYALSVVALVSGSGFFALYWTDSTYRNPQEI